MTHELNGSGPDEQPARSGGLDRRRFLRLGGATVALSALVAACNNNTEAGHIGRVGLAPTTTKLPTVTPTDVTLLRTCSSLQRSLIEMYNKIKDDPKQLDPSHRDLVTRLIADAEDGAKVFDGLTTQAGGEPWTCGNSKFDSVLVNPAYQRITVGAPATPESKAVPPSDDVKRDILTLIHGMETIIGAAYQQYVALLSKPQMRAQTLMMAVRDCRHSALLALVINPKGYVSTENEAAALATPETTAATSTTTGQNLGNTTTSAAAAGGSGGNTPTAIVPPTALPTTFGSTATLQIVVGAGDENGTRLKVNLETPSLNSYEYEYLQPSC